jgi:hypothetical protein
METLPAKKSKRPKIVLSDLKEIAKLVATRRLTETEACYVRGINPDQFFKFKTRAGRSEIFAKYVERLKSVKINSLLDQIEDISDGNEAIKQKPDWRAKQWLLTVTADRFGKLGEASVTTNNVQINLVTDALKRVFLDDTKPEQVTKIPARKLIN